MPEPRDVTAWLDRVFLSAAARSMRTGRQIQAVVDALEAAGPVVVRQGDPADVATAVPRVSDGWRGYFLHGGSS